VSGVTPVPISAILLLCGEGDLVIQDAVPAHDGASDSAANADPNFSTWWSQVHTNLVAAGWEQGPPMLCDVAGARGRNAAEDVMVSVSELGEWFSVRVKRDTAQQLQGLRSMLRLLFRVFCGDPSKFRDLVAEGKVGAIVLDLAATIFRNEVGATENPAVPSRSKVSGITRTVGSDLASATMRSHLDERGDVSSEFPKTSFYGTPRTHPRATGSRAVPLAEGAIGMTPREGAWPTSSRSAPVRGAGEREQHVRGAQNSSVLGVVRNAAAANPPESGLAPSPSELPISSLCRLSVRSQSEKKEFKFNSNAAEFVPGQVWNTGAAESRLGDFRGDFIPNHTRLSF